MKNLIAIAMTAIATTIINPFVQAQGGTQATSVAPASTEVGSAAKPVKERISPEKKAELKRNLEIRRGGPKIPRPGTLKGKIVIVNAQTSADAVWLDAAVAYLRKETNFTIELTTGEFAFPKPRIQGGATLYVIDDPKMPRVLAATEDRWCMMNVAPLKNAKSAFFEARVKKEISRAFAMLCGGMTSNYGISLVGAVTKSEDLDVFPDGKLPIDVVMRMEPYMTNLGVIPAKLVPYRIACQEGWAPAPTNDVQKAIWDEVRSLPQKPMKIEYDPKRGK